MNIKHLQAFIYLGRCGTFKEAARVLYHEGDPEDFVTPEALQYRVKNLEESLGISLYEKRQGTARVQLTREGQLFLPEAITIYQRMLRWQLMFSESTRGHLAFASTELVLLHRLPDIVHTFHVNFPQIRLTMLALGPQEIEEQVRRGDLDFGLATHPPESDDLIYKVWQSSNLVVVAPRGHELTRRDDLTLAEVAQHPLIMLSPDPSRNDDRERLNAALRRAGVSRIENTVLETSNSELIKCYVEAGLGIGIVAESSVMKMRRDLEVIRFGRQLGQTEVGLLVRREKVISKPMRNFFMLLSKDFESWPT